MEPVKEKFYETCYKPRSEDLSNQPRSEGFMKRTEKAKHMEYKLSKQTAKQTDQSEGLDKSKQTEKRRFTNKRRFTIKSPIHASMKRNTWNIN